MAGEGMSEKWRATHGSDHWKGMLDPLDQDLRQSILVYGDFIQATYDAFNSDPHSKYCGSSRYGKKNFFQKVALANEGEEEWDYEVTRFLYATASVDVPGSFMVKSMSREAWSRESNWIGYVAVATDRGKQKLGRRDIVVAWRGTIRNLEWIDVLRPRLQSIYPILAEKAENAEHSQHWYDRLLQRDNGSSSDDDHDESEPKVMHGWHVIYTSTDPKSPFVKISARDQFVAEMRRLLEMYKDEEVSITMVGHSLGAALSVLSAFDIVANGMTSSVPGKPAVPVAAFVVGCPGVGNAEFKRRFEALPELRVLHVVNVIDVIPHYPGKVIGYEHIGERLEIDTRKSRYLKDSKNPSDWHNLQAQLHIVAGWEGPDKPFELRVNRSVALVNKSCDFLTDECLVPGSWWVDKNKGMVKDENGLWVLVEPDEEDVPTPEEY